MGRIVEEENRGERKENLLLNTGGSRGGGYRERERERGSRSYVLY
jgi:hypothetical protein